VTEEREKEQTPDGSGKKGLIGKRAGGTGSFVKRKKMANRGNPEVLGKV